MYVGFILKRKNKPFTVAQRDAVYTTLIVSLLGLAGGLVITYGTYIQSPISSDYAMNYIKRKLAYSAPILDDMTIKSFYFGFFLSALSFYGTFNSLAILLTRRSDDD